MFLALDIGTSSTKAIVIDKAQRVMARAESGYATAHPAPGISEQDPALWIAAVKDCLGKIDSSLRSSLTAIGLSGQMHSLVALGDDLKPLCPAMLWNDSRGLEECRLLTQALPSLGTLTGVVAMPSFTAAKLLWLKRHRPAQFAQIRHVVLPKDYVRLAITGDLGSDMSDAAGSQLFDQAQRRWSPEVATVLGLDPDCLPPLFEGCAVAGAVLSSFAAEVGIPAGIPVAAGGGDAATGAMGLGCVQADQGLITLGTGTSIIVSLTEYAPHPEKILHTFSHAVPERWYHMAAMLNGASCLKWLAEGILGQADIGGLIAKVEERYRGPSSLIFLPYLSGERTPHNDPTASASFIGLDARHDGVDMAQAVIEGVAFSLGDAAHALDSVGCLPEALGFIGGGARSALWGRIIASVVNRPLVRYAGADLGPALGAARLAMIACGGSLAEVATTPAVENVIEPEADLVAAYGERQEIYRRLYPTLKRSG